LQLPAQPQAEIGRAHDASAVFQYAQLLVATDMGVVAW